MTDRIILSWTPQYDKVEYQHEVFDDQLLAQRRLHALIQNDGTPEVPDLSYRAYYLRDPAGLDEAIKTIDALLNSPNIVPISLRLIDGNSRQKPHTTSVCSKTCDAES